MSSLHESAFVHVQPTAAQIAVMNEARSAFARLVDVLEEIIPAGPDKTFVLRQLRDCAMWTNVALTRHPDGAPR